MNFQKFGRTSPFRAPLKRDDIGVARPSQLTDEEILSEADRIGNSLLHKGKSKGDPFSTQQAPELLSNKKPHLEEEDSKEEDIEAKRNQHISELIEELNFNRTRYEKLLSDHAEEKRYWMNYIKQLEAERDRLKY